MGRELQKKKRRSGKQPVRQPNKGRKLLNPRGNAMIAKNWDKKETLAQNYRRLGLLSRLKTPSGGNEVKLGNAPSAKPKANPFAITTTGKAVLSEAKVERDADGNILRVVSHNNNPLNDLLNSDDEDGDNEEEWGGIVHDGEQNTEVVQSLIEASLNPAPKKPRHMSEREVEWLETLIQAHGDDTNAMARDRKRNPMQQTARDIAKRIKKL